MEIAQRAKFQPYVWDELEKLIIILRLYKVGSVDKIKIISQTQKLIKKGN
jgi:hypothetical protein